MSSFKIALLECDIPDVKPKHGSSYTDLFRQQLSSSLPPSSCNLKFTLEGFDVVNAQKYPDLDKGGYKGVLISGSKSSAYDKDAWIQKLIKWVAETAEKKPHVKIIGVCFGHQIVAQAMGGRCIANNGNWEVGSTSFELTGDGKKVFGTKSSLALQEMHQDHVPKANIPPSFKNLGSSSICAVQGLVRYYPNTSDVHILTLQGHPEFTGEMVQDIIDALEAKHVLVKKFVDAGRVNAAKDDGRGAVGRAMWRVLGVE